MGCTKARTGKKAISGVNPFDPHVVKILLDLNREERENAFALLELVVSSCHVSRLRRLVAEELASRN